MADKMYRGVYTIDLKGDGSVFGRRQSRPYETIGPAKAWLTRNTTSRYGLSGVNITDQFVEEAELEWTRHE